MVVSLSGRGGSPVDEALLEQGFTRRISLKVPFGTLTPLIVAESDLVLTTARWLALKLRGTHNLVLKTPPINLAPAALPLVWHERTHHDPRQRWLRDILCSIAREIDPKKRRNP